MQPRRPHVQRAPSSSTTTCPISPAPPRPCHGLPSRIRPPPTPVPQNTPSSESIQPPGAQLELGVGGDLDVVADLDLAAERLFERAREREGAFPVGQVASACHLAVLDHARRADTYAGEGLRLDLGRLGGVAQRDLHLLGDICGSTARSGVGRRAEPIALCTSSTITAWILVPPRSIPP